MAYLLNLNHLKGIIKLANRYPFKVRFKVISDFIANKNKKGLNIDEYYNFNFLNQSEEFRSTFLGQNEQRYYSDLLNPIKYYTFARNKFVAHKILEDTGIRKTELYCYYQPEGHYILSDGMANDLHGVLEILRRKNVKQCVIKATESSHGDSVYVVNDIEYRDHDCLLTFFNDKKEMLSNILGKSPLILESVVKQTKQFAAFNESSINTVRFMTALYPDNKARIVATWMKFGRAGKCVDNAGAGGNVDACVDTKTGEIKHVVRFDGWDKVKPITHHPDSGNQLEGIKIDKWDEIVQQVLRFQECLPYVKCAGWDIAITDDGPVVIEVNDFWDRTGQLFIRKGWRNEIRDCYMAWKKTNVKYPMERQPNKLSLEQLQKIANRE